MKAFLLALIPAIALAGSYEGSKTSHFELLAEVTIDGYTTKSVRLNTHDYKTSTDCEKDGLLLGDPPPATVIKGHNVVYSIACREVKK